MTHHAADGRRYLVVHGDFCNARFLWFHLLTRIRSRADSLLRLLNAGLRRLRFRCGLEGRGPVEWMPWAVNDLLDRGRRQDRRLVALARACGHDGVICVHMYIAAMHQDFGPLYVKCGDWLDSFTAVAEKGSHHQTVGSNTYNPRRRHSHLGDLGHMEFEARAMLA